MNAQYAGIVALAFNFCPRHSGASSPSRVTVLPERIWGPVLKHDTLESLSVAASGRPLVPVFQEIPAPAREKRQESIAQSDRLVGLDAVRGIAALMVVVSHAVEEAIRLLPAHMVFGDFLRAVAVEYLNFGRIGVIAFFCVSGYVIPFSFTHKKPIPAFLIARFFRLYPAYWLSIAGALCIALVLGEVVSPPIQVLANITMFQTVLAQPDLVGVYWTLFYELLFYGLCLGAFVIGRMQSPAYLLLVVAGFSALGLIAAMLRHTGVATSLPIGLFLFLAIMHLGTLARLSDREVTPEARRFFAIALGIVLITGGPIVSIGFIQRASNQRLIADVTSLYVGLAVFFGLYRWQSIVAVPSLFLGRISYSLYLMHPLCLMALLAIAEAMPAVKGAVLVIACVPMVSIVVAWASEHFIERPGNHIGHRVRKGLLE